MACSFIPIYCLENRRMVRCKKCFYVSSLQAHKFNSRGGVPRSRSMGNDEHGLNTTYSHCLALSKSRSRTCTSTQLEETSLVEECRDDIEVAELLSGIRDSEFDVSMLSSSRMTNSTTTTGGTDLIERIMRQSEKQPSQLSLNLQNYSSRMSFDPPQTPPRTPRRHQIDPTGSMKSPVRGRPKKRFFFPDSTDEDDSSLEMLQEFMGGSDPVGISPARFSPPKLKRPSSPKTFIGYNLRSESSGEPRVPALQHR